MSVYYFFTRGITLGHIPVMSGQIQFLNWINTQKLNNTQNYITNIIIVQVAMTSI